MPWSLLEPLLTSNKACFSRVVDHHANLTDLHLGFRIRELILIQETGKPGASDKLASPDSSTNGAILLPRIISANPVLTM